MEGLLFVLWPGARARAYLQSALAAGLAPARAIVLGEENDDHFDPAWGRVPGNAFDLRPSLRESLDEAGVDTTFVTELDLRSPALAEAVKEAAPNWAVFSGGGIVRPELLGCAPRWIHVHPGRLPDWRGSTCIHYGLLLEGRSAATAFFLEESLDRGRALCHQHFTPTSDWDATSLDHAADAWMRAAVLVQALELLRERPTYQGRSQEGERGQMFYVVHPVLKHLAVLRGQEESRSEPDLALETV